MAQRGSGYNNPAFCNQFDNSLYDYEYVPEIDPDSPDLERKSSYRLSRQVAPKWEIRETEQKILNNSNSSSDESGSIIVEERNNRRVTLICEKRPKVIAEKDGSYAHDISLESTDSNYDYETTTRNTMQPPKQSKFYSRTSEPSSISSKEEYERHKFTRPVSQKTIRVTRHRYEDLGPPEYEEDMNVRNHRYAMIDEELQTEGVHFAHRKPRAPSPIYYPSDEPFSPKFEFSQNFSPDESFGSYRHSSSPIAADFELSDFSPPLYNQRQPPVGASAVHVPEPLQKIKRAHSMKNPCKKSEEVFARCSPMSQDKKNLLTPKNSVKLMKVSSGKGKTQEKEVQKHSVRRNISNSFMSEKTGGSPYRPTTQTLSNKNTAIITPILQRKFAELTREGSNFQKASKMFQSMNNVSKGVTEGRAGYQVHPQNNFNYFPNSQQGMMKRNQSVPNFQQHHEKRTPTKVRPEPRGVESPLTRSPVRNFGNQSSPMSLDKFSPFKLAFTDPVKSPSSDFEEEDYVTSPTSCLMVAAIIQLLAGMVTCGICFYLLSKLGRRYYLDCGVLAGFITTVLGALGFRSKSWKWLPNRNYVSGYVILGAFSILNVASLVLIISVRPMAGDPLLDVCAGAICAVSVIVIGLALTGLTLSGCCKTPPPDNRVTTTYQIT